MTEERIDKRQSDEVPPATLREGVEVLRSHLSSVRLETLTEASDTALSVRFIGDEANLKERSLLVQNLVRYLPLALSIIGVKTRQEEDAETSR